MKKAPSLTKWQIIRRFHRDMSKRVRTANAYEIVLSAIKQVAA